MAHVSAEQAYYVVLRTLVAGKQSNWVTMGHMNKLRAIMGLSDDLHKQYLEQINGDPEVCAMNGSAPQAPAAKRQRMSGAAAPGSAPPIQRSKNKSRPPRPSDPGAAFVQPVPTYGLPHRRGPGEDGNHGLIGLLVNLVQEDDTVVQGIVVDWNPADGQHYVVVQAGTPQESGEWLPLTEYPESWQNLGPARDYVPPHAVPVHHALVAASMPPPATRPRSNSAGTGGAPPRPKHRGGGGSGTKIKPGGGAGGAGGAGAGQLRLGQPPYNQAALDARLAAADLPELATMLAAISRKEKALMADLDASQLGDEELSRSLMERDELVRQISAH